MSEDTIIRRVRALLAKAKSTDNEHEAAAFAAKAAEMLQTHNLDLASIERSAGEQGEAVSEVRLNWRYCDPWRKSIARACAELYFCKIYRHHIVEQNKKGTWTYRWGITIVGKPHNAAVAESMIEYLIGTTLRLMREYSSVRAEQLPFARGCGERLAARLREMEREAKRKSAAATGHATVRAAEEAGSGNLPALYKTELELVESHMETLGLEKGRRSAGSDLSGHHAAEGIAAGNTVSLAPQVGDGTCTSRMLSHG